MSQIETTKVVEHILIGPDSDEIAVPKVVMYVWAVPGGDSDDGSNRQGHVHTQIFRRD